ncbi:MAG: hypothetical protein JNM60_09120 [Candidatus Competibacteraceae bacterium]|nr:hypothetical protein [Candidatus Competibacteraceae bacterium]
MDIALGVLRKTVVVQQLFGSGYEYFQIADIAVKVIAPAPVFFGKMRELAKALQYRCAVMARAPPVEQSRRSGDMVLRGRLDECGMSR